VGVDVTSGPARPVDSAHGDLSWRVPARVAALATPDVVALVTLALFVTAIAGLTWGTWGDPGQDTGYDMLAAQRIVDGHLPYVDFQYYYGPLGVFALSGFFAVAGAGFDTALALGVAITASIVFATYRVARIFLNPLGAGLVAAVVAPLAFAPTNISFVLPYSESVSFAILLLLLAIVALAGIQRGQPHAWFGLGACLGLLTLTRPEFALAAVVGVAVVVVLRVREHTMNRRDVSLLGLPAVAIPVSVYAGFLVAGASVHGLLFENLYPRAQLAAGGNHVLRLHAPMTLQSFGELLGRTVLYAAGFAALVAFGVLLGRVRSTVLRVALCMAPFVLAAGLGIARPETLRYYLNFAWFWIPLGAAALAVYLVWQRYTRRGFVGEDALLALAVVVGLLALKSYAAFAVYGPIPQYGVYVVPFAAVLLGWAHLGPMSPLGGHQLGAVWLACLALFGAALIVGDARSESPVVGLHGSLAADRELAPVLQQAVDGVVSVTRPGEPVLLAPQLSSVLFLTGRADPGLRQLQLLPNALPSPADQQAAIAALERARVRVALIDRQPFTSYGHGRFGETFDRQIDAWLSRAFRRVAVYSSPGKKLELWVRVQ